MPKKRKITNKRLLAAHESHAKFLRSHGIDPTTKPILKGVEFETYVRPEHVTSDCIPGSGSSPKKGHGNAGKVIGQPYHKGPLMVLSSVDDLKTNKRRDR